MTLSLSKLQECAERADHGTIYSAGESWRISDAPPPEVFVPDDKLAYERFKKAFMPETALALIRVARAASKARLAKNVWNKDGLYELEEALKEIEE